MVTATNIRQYLNTLPRVENKNEYDVSDQSVQPDTFEGGHKVLVEQETCVLPNQEDALVVQDPMFEEITPSEKKLKPNEVLLRTPSMGELKKQKEEDDDILKTPIVQRTNVHLCLTNSDMKRKPSLVGVNVRVAGGPDHASQDRTISLV